MRFDYISPSELPSRTANSVHVVLQCDALARAGADVTLYAKRSIEDEGALLPALRRDYGVEFPNARLVTFHSRSHRADNLKIAVMALGTMSRRRPPDMILSRNLYAAYAIGVLQRRRLLFETHQLELGFRKAMQRAIMTRPWVTTVVISQALASMLAEHQGVPPSRCVVLHDAARAGSVPVPREERRKLLMEVVPGATAEWDAVCGYFGHLYAGRGVEIIETVAKARPRILFLAVGGTDEDVRRWRAHCPVPNLLYAGYLPPILAQQAMRAVDVLLMPYQSNVSIGVSGHDTARFMSPLKMFEYMSSGVPLISSDLPVLREVLHEGVNALLAPANDPRAWIAAVDRLIGDEELAERIGRAAYGDYLTRYTWDHRASALLAAF